MANSMAVILKNVIRNGSLPLTQVNERIETMYLSGRISGEERNELTELMHEKADPANEAGDYKALYETLVRKYNELEARVAAIEGQIGGVNEDETPDGGENWEPWDGVSDQYQKGAVVVHGGRIWESTFEGQNVWEPGVPGIDERYWKEIVITNPEDEE